MPLKIYKSNLSPPVRAVMMTAELLNLNYESQEVNLLAKEHLTTSYLEKNPQHTIPLLEDGDFRLADSHAIMTYLVSKYGTIKHAKLYPSDLNLRATVDQRMYFEASILFPALRTIVQRIIREHAPGPTSQQVADIHSGYDTVDAYLQKTKFVACDHLTVADLSCVSIIPSLAILAPIDSKYEKLNAWWNALKEEKWYKKYNDPGLLQLEGILKTTMKKNGGDV